MGWIKIQIHTNEEIFNDLIKKFGKTWNISYLPHGNGSPYEYFSDYIKDYYDVTIRQCTEICKMIKEYYNIEQFYYNEIKK